MVEDLAVEVDKDTALRHVVLFKVFRPSRHIDEKLAAAWPWPRTHEDDGLGTTIAEGEAACCI